MKKILIAEISGKRPGTEKQRPTEKFHTKHDKVIISNNSDGYITDWPIINVPDDYREWYIKNHKNSENAWYAPMNRSYAIKYAKEHGYDYLVQMDDNILALEVACLNKKTGQRIRIRSRKEMIDDYIDLYSTILQNTNAVMVGCQLAGLATPDTTLLREGYVYSFFMLKLSQCPEVFQGDFEDDIEYRLKCKQMGLPVVQVAPIRYSKVGQAKNKDLSGNRTAYAKAGLKRGEHMTQLYGDLYSAHMTNRANRTNANNEAENSYFKHTLKHYRVGVIVYDMDAIKACFYRIIKENYKHTPDKAIIKVKHKRG